MALQQKNDLPCCNARGLDTRRWSNLCPDVSKKRSSHSVLKNVRIFRCDPLGAYFCGENFIQKYTILHVKVYDVALLGPDVSRNKAI